MVVEADAERRDVTETILAKLRFAVAPVGSVEQALAVMRAVRPNVIVCSASDEEKVRDGLFYGEIPIVPLTDQPEELLENIRIALRARVIPLV